MRASEDFYERVQTDVSRSVVQLLDLFDEDLNEWLDLSVEQLCGNGSITDWWTESLGQRLKSNKVDLE